MSKFDDIKMLAANVREVMKLYNISEAEEHIIMEIATLVKMMGLSPQLTLKCMQALTTSWELVIDQMRKDGQLKD